MFHKSGVDIWSGGVCYFRRRVVRVWAKMAHRDNSQSDKHYPWKLNCPWSADTTRWTSTRHCVPVNHPSMFTEKCSYYTCCRKHERRRPEYLEGLDIIQYFPPKGQLFSSHCGPSWGWGKEHETVGKGAEHNLWKNDIAQGHNVNQLKSIGSKMTSQI